VSDAGDATLQGELARLARELHETQRRIADLTGGEVDAVVDPSGYSYLLPHAQERLRKDEEIQRRFATERAAILDALPAHIALLDSDGRIVAVNEAWRRFASANVLVSRDFSIGDNYLEICAAARGQYSEEAREAGRGIRNVLDGNDPHFALEYPCHSPSEKRWFRLIATPIDEARRAGTVVMHVDITDRKLAEEALRASERHYRVLFENNPHPMWVFDLETLRFLAVNDAATNHYGYSRDEFLAMAITQIRPEEEVPRLMERLASAEEDLDDTGVWRHRTKDGRTISVHIATHAIEFGGRRARLVLAQDVTKRRAAEEALLKSQALLRMASKISRLGGWSLDVADRTMTWSDEVRAIHEMPEGYSATLEEGMDLFAPEYRETIKKAFEDCICHGTPYDLEIEKFTASGRRIWIRTMGEAVRGEGGAVIRVQGALQDITDRKLAEEALRQKEFLLRIAGKVAQVGGWAIDLPDHTVHWSDEICDILEYPRGDVPSLEESVNLYAPASRRAITDALDRCCTDGTPFDLELEINTRTGRAIWARCWGEAEFGEGGAVKRARGAFQDITAHKEAQSRESRLAGQLTATLESLTDAFLTLDRDWRVTYFNREAERLTGRNRGELLGHILWEEFPQAADLSFYREYHRAVAENVSVEFEEYFAPLGMWIGVRAFPTPDGLAVYFRDISEQRQAREALRASEERFRLFSKATNDAIWDWNLETNGLWWNDGFTTLFGFKTDDVTPSIEFWSNLIHPDEREGVLADIQREITMGGLQWSGEYRFRRRNGTYAYVMDRGYIIRNADGEATRMIGGMTDLTSRRETEARLAEQAALLDLASDAIMVRDLHHRILFWSRGAETIYGWRSEEVLNKSVQDKIYEDREAFAEADAAVMAEGEWSGELRQRTRSGEPLIIFGRWTLVRDAFGQPEAVLSINTDITERKYMEQKFLRAQRMESIGTLAGGIAHDLNNVLAPILMAVEILKDSVEDEDGRDMLDTIGDSAQRGADLIKQVLSFARGVAGKRIRLDPGHIAREIKKIVFDTFPRNIYCEVKAARDLWMVDADPTQLHQVLMNLCVNARDAMPEGGRLEILLENTVVDEVYSGMNPEATPGPYVMLRISDTGSGMPKDVQDKIFEPFFTTKDLGKGTGLGLSTTFTIVRDHGGFINLYSELGKGTKFKVYLPASAGAGETERVAVEQTNLPRGNGELILVVDDEEGIREVAKKVLERFGYRVILARNGAEGVSTYVRNQAEIALVLTDMSMPIMDGPAMIVALKSINPDILILGCSGLAANGNVAKATGAGVEHFVPKPYTAETLLTKLAEMLSGAATPAVATATLLVALKDPSGRESAVRILETSGYSVVSAATREEALAVLLRHGGSVRLVLMDPLTAGGGLAATVLHSYPGTRVLVAADSPEGAIAFRETIGLDVLVDVAPIPADSAELAEKVRAIFGA